MKKLLGIITMMLLIVAPVHAEQVWTFEPVLPTEGSSEWETSLNVKFNHYDFTGLLYSMGVPGGLTDQEIDQYVVEFQAELQSVLKDIEAQTIVQQVRIDWQAHPDPSIRAFEMHSTIAGIYNVQPVVPDFVAGLVANDGDLISISEPLLGAEEYREAIQGVLLDFIVPPSEPTDALSIDFIPFPSSDEPLIIQDSDVTVYFSTSQVLQ